MTPNAHILVSTAKAEIVRLSRALEVATAESLQTDDPHVEALAAQIERLEATITFYVGS